LTRKLFYVLPVCLTLHTNDIAKVHVCITTAIHLRSHKPTLNRSVTSMQLAKQPNKHNSFQRKIFRKTFPKSWPSPEGLVFLFFVQWLPAAAPDATQTWCSWRRICRMMEWNASSTNWRRAADVSKNGQSHWLANATPSSLFTCTHVQQVSTTNSQSKFILI